MGHTYLLCMKSVGIYVRTYLYLLNPPKKIPRNQQEQDNQTDENVSALSTTYYQLQPCFILSQHYSTVRVSTCRL